MTPGGSCVATGVAPSALSCSCFWHSAKQIKGLISPIVSSHFTSLHSTQKALSICWGTGVTSERAGEVTGRLRRGRRRDVIPLLLLLGAVLVCARVKGVSGGTRKETEGGTCEASGIFASSPTSGSGAGATRGEAAAVEVVEESRIWIGRAAWPHRRLRKAPNKGSVSAQLSSAKTKKCSAEQGRAPHSRRRQQSKAETKKTKSNGERARGGLRMQGRTGGGSDQKSNDIEKQSDDAEPVSHAREGEASFEILLSCSPLLLALFLA